MRRACSRWIAAGAGYPILEAIAAAGFRHQYSYGRNYKSDLGVTYSGMFQGRHDRLSAGPPDEHAFYLQGTHFLVGAVLVARAVESQNPGFFRTLAATNAAENILVSTVHGGPIAKIDGTAWLHGAGAVLAIVGGNMAILDGGTAIARAASLGLAVLGLLSFMTLVIDSKSAGIRVLPDGAWERGSVCSIIVVADVHSRLPTPPHTSTIFGARHEVRAARPAPGRRSARHGRACAAAR